METQNNNDILLIEDYLDGKLSKSEREAFEKRLKNERGLAELYWFREKIREDWQKVRNYQAASQKVESVIKQLKNNNRRKIIYAVAASLAVMIVIAGALTFDFRGEQQQVAETKIDSAKTQTFEPQIKQPESYANSGEYNEAEFSLSHQIKNDSIVLSWQPAFNTETDLIILLQKNEKEAFRTLIKPGLERMVLYRNDLPAEEMVWYIEGYSARDSFEVQ